MVNNRLYYKDTRPLKKHLKVITALCIDLKGTLCRFFRFEPFMIVSLGDSRGQQKDSFSQLCNYKGYSTFFSPRHLFFRNNFFPRQVFLGYLFKDKKLEQLFFGTKKFKTLFPESKTYFLSSNPGHSSIFCPRNLDTFFDKYF